MDVFDPLLPEDPPQVGPYRIEARLGAGGMGQVYFARSKSGRAVAVKVVHPEHARDADFRARFAREIALARTVSGFFTAGVVDADPHGTPAWLATAYVPGISLSDAVRDHGPWPEPHVITLGVGLAEALHSIHAAGIIHRDLKPSNVLLAADGPRIIDFGISVAVDSSRLTHTGMAVGTPGFMSPEQLTGDPVGPPSDVFCLGTVLAFTATGTGPFGTGSWQGLWYRIVNAPPDLTALSPALQSVIAPCLHKDPGQRPTVTTVLDQLAGLAQNVNAGRTTAQTFADLAWLPRPVARAVHARNATTTVTAALPESPPPPTPTPGTRAGTAPISAEGPATTPVPGFGRFTPPPPVGTPVPLPAPGHGLGPVPVPGPVPHKSPNMPYAAPASTRIAEPGVAENTGETADDDDEALLAERRRREERISRRTVLGVLGLAGIGAATAGYMWLRKSRGAMLWTFDMDSRADSAPIAEGAVIYSGSTDKGTLYAVDAKTGAELWAYNPGGDNRGAVEASPPVLVDDVVCTTIRGALHAVDIRTGAERWVHRNSLVKAVASLDGIVYLATGEKRLHGVEARTGKYKVTVTLTIVPSELTITPGRALVADAAGTVRALNLPTGYEEWYASGASTVLELSTNAYVAGARGIQKIDAATGENRWEHRGPEDGGDWNSVAISDRLVCYVIRNTVHAVDGNKGTELWTRDIDKLLPLSPQIHKNMVYVASESGVHAIDATDGTRRWDYESGSIKSLTLRDSALYVYAGSGRLVRLDAADGREFWSLDAGTSDPQPSPATFSGDFLYMNVRNTLIAVEI